MKTKPIIPTIAIVAALAIAALFLFRGTEEEDRKPAAPRSAAAKHEPKQRAPKPKIKAPSAEKVAKKRAKAADIFKGLTGADRSLAEAIQDALDEDDFKKVCSLAESVMKHENPEVRRLAVEALGSFGEEALPELTVWMSDPNEEVAQEAMSQWSGGLAEVEKPENRYDIALAAFKTISDADTLGTIGMELSYAANELIDNEEDEAVASKRRIGVIQSLGEIILGGQEKNAAAAREAYEDITGNRWISVEEAEKYLRDPENYEAPEEKE